MSYVCDNPDCRDHVPNPHGDDTLFHVYLNDTPPEASLLVLDGGAVPTETRARRRLVCRWPYNSVCYGTLYLCDVCHETEGVRLARRIWGLP